MSKCVIILVLSTVLLSSCIDKAGSECVKLNVEEVGSLIAENISEDYIVVGDTINDSTYMLSIEQISPSKTVLERYVFDEKGELTEFLFYNDFQKSNPLLLRARLKCNCIDSIDFEGGALCYRFYELDSSDVFYVRVASPLFLEAVLTLTKSGDVMEQITDTVKLNKNTWAYGVRHDHMMSVDYDFKVTYRRNGDMVFYDSLKLVLNNVPE